MPERYGWCYQRSVSLPVFHSKDSIYTNKLNSTSGNRTYENFAKAAEEADDSTAPRSTGGGEIATATGTWAPSGTASSTETAASSTETSDANAGLEARGEIRWGLMAASMAMAGLFGGLMM